MPTYGQHSKLFDVQAADYAAYRPDYPKELYTRLLEFAGAAQREAAVDIATGSGQAATELSTIYKSVIGLDPSTKQLEQAMQAKGVEYRQGSAEDTGLPDSSFDLVAVAQALHWFELADFYWEAKRILRPGGVLAIWGYDRPFIRGNDKAEALVLEIYSQTFGPYWDKRRFHIDDHLAGLEPPQQDWREVTRQEFSMHKPMSVRHLLRYLQTWSAYNTFKQQHPSAADPLDRFEQELLQAYGTADDSTIISVDFPIFLLLAKRPR